MHPSRQKALRLPHGTLRKYTETLTRQKGKWERPGSVAKGRGGDGVGGEEVGTVRATSAL